MTLMFTHKATGAWDALTKGLMEAGFTITASWPINTEAEGGLHIKDKSAANSTIFLVCRPRASTAYRTVPRNYWEDIEPLVARAVRARVTEFQQAGIGGVDLYLASFGPALEEFSRHWPLKRGTPRPKPEALRRRRQTEMFEDEWDPYAVTPEDALDAARREVKRWRLEQLTHMKASEELDPLTSFFVLAWDAFRAPVFPYDEALRLARAVGVDLDTQVVGVLIEKKGSDLRHVGQRSPSRQGCARAADGSRGMIDALHHAAHLDAPAHCKRPERCWPRAAWTRSRCSSLPSKPCWKCCRSVRHSLASTSKAILGRRQQRLRLCASSPFTAGEHRSSLNFGSANGRMSILQDRLVETEIHAGSRRSREAAL